MFYFILTNLQIENPFTFLVSFGVGNNFNFGYLKLSFIRVQWTAQRIYFKILT